jgi:hypothetical protein
MYAGDREQRQRDEVRKINICGKNNKIYCIFRGVWGGDF